MNDIRLPVRIQRSRRKGWRQPANTLYCGRPSEWANPFVIGDGYTRESSLAAFRRAFWSNQLSITPKKAYKKLRRYAYLSCWCGLDEECHVDEFIEAIRVRHERKGAICLHCPHRLRNHYTIKLENEAGKVDTLGAACAFCNTDDPDDPEKDALCLALKL